MKPEVGPDYALRVGPFYALSSKDHAGDAGPDHGVFQAHGDGLLGRILHRLQGDQFHVLVAQGPTHRQIAQADAEDDQAFGLADLDRVVDHPDPIGGDRLGAQEGRQAEP